MTEENNFAPEEQVNPEKEIIHESIKQEQDPTREKAGRPIFNRLFILNIILLVGLAVLYILFFTSGRDSGETGVIQAVSKANNGITKVAFVNNDSILVNYELVKKLKKELQVKGDRYSEEVANKQASFEKDAAYFQEQVQKKTISEESAQEIYAKLMENQQKIYDLKDRYSAELQISESDMNVVLLDSVMNFLKRYNQKYKFDYILGFNKVGNILYANDTLDITNDVIRELNKEYLSKHSGK
jgi:outer membrane protein